MGATTCGPGRGTHVKFRAAQYDSSRYDIKFSHPLMGSSSRKSYASVLERLITGAFAVCAGLVDNGGSA